MRGMIPKVVAAIEKTGHKMLKGRIYCRREIPTRLRRIAGTARRKCLE